MLEIRYKHKDWSSEKINVLKGNNPIHIINGKLRLVNHWSRYIPFAELSYFRIGNGDIAKDNITAQEGVTIEYTITGGDTVSLDAKMSSGVLLNTNFIMIPKLNSKKIPYKNLDSLVINGVDILEEMLAPVCVSQPPSDATVLEGTEKVIVSAWENTQEYQWFFDDNTGVYRAIADGATFGGTDTDSLTIKSMSETTVGRYICVGYNTGGMSRTDSQVAIIGMTPAEQGTLEEEEEE